MNSQKYLKKTLSILNLILAISVIASVFYGGGINVNAGTPTPPAKPGASAPGGMPNDTIGGSTEMGQMRTTTNAMRIAAAANQKANKAAKASPDKANKAPAGMNALGTPDYFGVANWANSPLPIVAADGTISGGLQKFIDPLPVFCPAPNLGQPLKCIPLGIADTNTFKADPTIPNTPAADFYDIGLVEYREQMHSNLPLSGTKLRGYVQLYPLGTTKANNGTGLGVLLNLAEAGVPQTIIDPTIAGGTTARLAYYKPQYLGPIIKATGCDPLGTVACVPVPVRVKFENLLPADTAGSPNAGDLFIPTDTTYMGAGDGSKCDDGTEATPTSTCTRAGYSQNRATLHLHGGNSPWISDGTAHQWTAPSGEATFYAKGDSVAYVPDMWFDAAGKLIASCAGKTTCATPGASNNPGPGALTFYWTNQQSGRLMFFHDHSYGMTRLNVYAGEAAGYLLVDSAVETALMTAGVPSPNGVTDSAQDLSHVVPLILQDKTFVPDDGTAANSQLAATDPTWSTAKWGSTGDLWFPHVYVPNQNPADITGANAYGRWDYGPWFWPAQNPATYVAGGQPFTCTSSAYPGGVGIAFPPLVCPGTPNPSGTPESFMDTAMVNGAAYPTLTVDPTVYRFQVLNASNDRTLNLSWYKAEPLTIAVTVPGSGYVAAPAPVVNLVGGVGGTLITAAAVVSSGSVSSLTPGLVGGGYPTIAPAVPPIVTISGDGTGAVVTATVDPVTNTIFGYTVVNGGTGYTNATATIAAPSVCTPIAPYPCATATATVNITGAGTITDIVVTPAVGFTPYTTAPTVTIAAPSAGGTQAFATAAVNTEVKMVDAVPHSTTSLLKPCDKANADPNGPNLATGLLDGLGNPLNGTGQQANCYPDSWPHDGRDGGVPDPLAAGPAWVQIGTEGGSLPAPVVIPATPSGYEYNRKSITVLNIFTHGLLMGPAERADTVVDFSQFAGQTLLLYNDAPTPVPAFDPRTDYYTGGPDLTSVGGAPTTLPGYGPNTRTYMQVKVNLPNANPVGKVTMATLKTQMTSIWNNNQDQIIIPEKVYPTAGNGASATNNYIKIQDNFISPWIGNPVGGVTMANGGSGYQAAPTVTFSAPPVATLPAVNVTATGVATISGGVGAINIINGGAGYTAAPAVTIGAPPVGGVQAAANATITGGVVTSFTITNPGIGYLTAPVVTIAAPPPGNGHRRATASSIFSGSVTGVTLTNAGSGYTAAPTITFTNLAIDTNGAGAAATAESQHMEPKAIQELFTLDYGRMNATLGVELPFTNFGTQTTIPYGFVDPPTELFRDGETQIWKITHNGVDTHFMHFHLFNVQVINRVGWDGAIKPPEANEIGWKDTVRMNPLEDIIVALKTLKQTLPWELPNSVRRMNVTEPVGSTSAMAYTNVDPANQPAVVTNDVINFGYEYMWHCHILGHEENDMMRSMLLGVMPQAPTNLTAVIQTSTPPSPLSRAVKLTWTDNSMVESNFTVQRSTDGGLSWPVSLKAPGNPGTGGTVTYFDTTVRPRRTYWYRVMASNVIGYTKAFAAPIVGYASKTYDSAPVAQFAPVVTNSGGRIGVFDSKTNPFFLFAGGFESKNGLAGWDASATGLTQWTKAENVSFDPQAAMGPNAGTTGLAAVLSNKPAYVSYTMTTGQPTYDANFYFDANASDSGSSAVDIFTAKDLKGLPAFGIQYQVVVKEMEPTSQLRGWVMHAGVQTFTPWTDITNGPHYLETSWESGARGWFSLSVNDRLTGATMGDTHTQSIQSVVLGPSSGGSASSSGTMYFDDFGSTKLNAIPVLVYAPIMGR